MSITPTSEKPGNDHRIGGLFLPQLSVPEGTREKIRGLDVTADQSRKAQAELRLARQAWEQLSSAGKIGGYVAEIAKLVATPDRLDQQARELIRVIESRSDIAVRYAETCGDIIRVSRTLAAQLVSVVPPNGTAIGEHTYGVTTAVSGWQVFARYDMDGSEVLYDYDCMPPRESQRLAGLGDSIMLIEDVHIAGVASDPTN